MLNIVQTKKQNNVRYYIILQFAAVKSSVQTITAGTCIYSAVWQGQYSSDLHDLFTVLYTVSTTMNTNNYEYK